MLLDRRKRVYFFVKAMYNNINEVEYKFRCFITSVNGGIYERLFGW